MRGEKPLEEQPERDRIGRGDAEGVADRRVSGTAAALAVDVVAATEVDDVPNHEEVAGEAELLDEREFPIDRRPGPRAEGKILPAGRPSAVAAMPTLLGEST